MSRLDALLLSTPLIAVMVVLCAVLLFQRRGRNRRRNCYLRDRPFEDSRNWSRIYMDKIGKGRFG